MNEKGSIENLGVVIYANGENFHENAKCHIAQSENLDIMKSGHVKDVTTCYYVD